MDDSSSALDYQTDARLRKALRQNSGSTTIVVAQRVSSIRYADHILVMENGKAVGYGTHEELMRNCIPVSYTHLRFPMLAIPLQSFLILSGLLYLKDVKITFPEGVESLRSVSS